MLGQYFLFQVFNFFIVLTLANSIFVVLQEIIDHPRQLVELLGTSLPKVGCDE